MRGKSFNFLLSILSVFTEYFSKRILSLRSACSLLSLPHLAVLSISIHKLIEGMKKSMLNISMAFCVSNLIHSFNKISLKAISCGHNFCFFSRDLARFMDISFILLGLLSFIRSLDLFARAQVSFVFPHMKWFSPLFLVNCVDSLIDLVLKPSFLAKPVSPCLVILDLLESSFRDISFLRCSSLMICSKGILKNFSDLVRTQFFIPTYTTGAI